MKITESQLRKIVRRLLSEEKAAIPNDSPPEKQVHVFDFDDTLGVTSNPNGIMLYRDGQPAWQSPDDVKDWLSKAGIPDSDILEPGITPVRTRNGYAVYLNSDGLAKIQAKIPRSNQGAAYQTTEPNAYRSGDSLLIDFSPSGETDAENTKPIEPTIDKLKQVNAQGSRSIVMTARKAGGHLQDFDGNPIPATNDKDMYDFLSKQGAAPTLGVVGLVGGNKGTEIVNDFMKDDPPEEIHFYDDSSRNTEEVESAVAEKYPSELFIYGPGNFDQGKSSPDMPKKSFPAKEDQVVERWCKLAGIID